MTPRLRRRTGFEIELMAPPGRSRRSLAYDLAGRLGGRIRPVWHSDSEPSLVPGLGRFLHLTQGFEVLRADGTPLCTLVDDITLLDDLQPRTPAQPGWYRVLSDDPRVIALLAKHCDPGAPLDRVLDPVAALWGVETETVGDVIRLDDPSGATIALAAPQGAERERPCEIVTPPIAAGHLEALDELLGPARELGFTVPREAAVHLHVDGAPFRAPRALANVVLLAAHYREALRELLQTNPACRRLAPLPPELVAAADRATPSADELRKAAREGGLTKYFDVNLTQLLTDRPKRDTLEIRILPGAIDAAEIVHRAALFELLLDRCEDPEPFPVAPAGDVSALLEIMAEALANQT
ncbi:amidoligase family protein [Actinoplanes sp. KI2]|uniref:amidoligase family protein n=1 Tax=Actinoplanes sp. KI2 TaxID=2983315 RepID=UPI0021D60C8A|nr:amidoligase family protein [Actinoplanes sp. KI2]MCU7728081.1 amidoligase family protein [Actinoplanes sp. KI2]